MHVQKLNKVKLYKANELGNILAVCLNPRDLDWSGTLMGCFDLTMNLY